MTILPDVSVTKIREDFENIFLKNVITMTLERRSSIEAGNYGNIDEDSGLTTSTVDLNVQGISTGNFKDALQGVDNDGSTYHAYAQYTTDIQNNDLLKWNNIIFVVKNQNNSYKDGQLAFFEFDLVVVGKYD